jgi:DNA-directed RNA polymerase specialized sigma54-like protein
MKIELTEKEIQLLIGALQFLDPTGFFTGKLIKSLLEQIEKPKDV